ncbi:MAG: hypothetical protein HKN68_11525 [Saprospiraceae bacterium]|nr:hypothetical protein [Saprospiraceae bacterium]
MQIQTLPYNKDPIKKKKGIGSSAETLYRVTLRNQLRSIGIADQKAKVLIGINTILISLFIAVIGLVSNVAELNFIKNLNLSLPFTIMVISCFFSGAMAIIAVRPNDKLWDNSNPSQLSFRNFHGMSLDEYLDDMDMILESRKTIYRSLNIDLYLYGICLQKKNKLLRHAFTVFLAGLTLAVICFTILRLVGPSTLGYIN